MFNNNTEKILKPEIDENIAIGIPFQVILFNDDYHTFDEVIFQLQKALKCPFEIARDFAMAAHVHGQTIIFRGEISKCLRISSVLEEIALHTQIAA